MTDLDERLRDFASRWNDAQAADPAPILPTARTPRPARLLSGSGLRWSAAGIAVAAAIALIILVARPGSNSNQVSTQNPLSGVPTAGPPLLRHELAPTPLITLFTDHTDGVSWNYFAQADPKDPSHGLGPELCVGTGTTLGYASECDDPTTLSSLTFDPIVVEDDPGRVLLSGFTSVPASNFSIAFGGHTVSATALSSPRLPGLEFYAVPIPAGDYTANGSVQVVAFAEDGHPLLQTTATHTPPMPPFSPTTLPTGNHPTTGAVWPLPKTATFTNPTAVVIDFAAHALGLAHPQLTVSSGESSTTTDSIDLKLSATGQNLNVVAQQQPNGTWALFIVGDQAQLRGVTYLPGGHPGAVMSLLPPHGATQADITQVAADGVHHFHLDQTQVASDNADLATSPIQSILIVYRNPAGQVVGALGGTFVPG